MDVDVWPAPDEQIAITTEELSHSREGAARTAFHTFTVYQGSTGDDSGAGVVVPAMGPDWGARPRIIIPTLIAMLGVLSVVAGFICKRIANKAALSDRSPGPC